MNEESGLSNRCITRIHYTQSNKESCLWNRCISRYIILEQLKESHVSGTDVSPDTSYMSLEQMYLQIHHTGTVKRVTCLWNRCISRYIILEQLKESHVSGTDVSPDTSYMSLEQMYLQIHHTGTIKRVTCLWNRCISRYIILEQLKESHVSGTDVSPDTSYWNS